MRHRTAVQFSVAARPTPNAVLLVVALLAAAACTPSFEGYTTEGDRIVDRATGEPVHLIGFGLGGWLLPEGYMWGIRALDRPWQFEEAIEDLIGPADAAEFWRRYHDNYVIEDDFRAMAAMGANSIRPALLASKLMPPQQPAAPPYVFSDEGFRFLDSVVVWGERYGMGIIWDMHGAPGAQNAENIADSDGEARLWTEADVYWPRLDALWRRIAERYAGNPYIIGYDLLNEPLLRRYEGIDEADLRRLYVRLTETIREVDPHGIIFIEGDDWAQNFRALEPIDWDPHLALAFHSYPPTASAEGLARWDSLRTRWNVPLWHGETGEVVAPFDRNRESTTFLRTADVGWSWWTHKKIARESQPWHCPPTEGFQRILDYWQGRAERPTAEQARAWLFDQAEKVHTRYCDFSPEMVASLDGLDPDRWLAIREPEAPAIYLQPAGAEVEVGGVAVLGVRATGYPLEYGWLRDGEVVSGEEGPTIAVVPTAEADAGLWRVVASNALGADTSEAARVTVRPFAGMVVPRAARFGALTPLTRLVTGPAMPDPSDLAARWALRWDDGGLHGRVEVTDAVVRNQDGRAAHNDGVELYLDLDNAKALGYEADDVQIRVTRAGAVAAERGTLPAGFIATQRETARGYVVEFTVPLAAATGGAFIGIDVHVIDNDNDRREHKIGWAALNDDAYRSPAAMGTVRLGG